MKIADYEGLVGLSKISLVESQSYRNKRIS